MNNFKTFLTLFVILLTASIFLSVIWLADRISIDNMHTIMKVMPELPDLKQLTDEAKDALILT